MDMGINLERFNYLDDAIVDKWEQEQEQAQIDRLLRQATIPENYQQCSLRNFEVKCSEDAQYLAKMKAAYNKLTSGEVVNFVLTGDCGVGKTHLGCGMLRDYLIDGSWIKWDIKFYPTIKYKLSDQIRAKYMECMSFDSPISQNEYISAYGSYDLLCIDEVGRAPNKEKELDVLYKIINERYNNKLSTILISNKKPFELVDYLGSAIVDRLKKGAAWISADGVRSKR